MAGNPPERLLKLGRREKEPADHLSSLLRIYRDQPLVAVLLGQIENDRDGFRENHLTVDEHRKLSGRIDFKECGTGVLAGEQIDGNGLEVDVQIPAASTARGSSGSEQTRRASLRSPLGESEPVRQIADSPWRHEPLPLAT